MTVPCGKIYMIKGWLFMVVSCASSAIFVYVVGG